LIGLFWEVGEVITQTKVFKMRLACLLTLIAVTGCSESPRTTFDLAVFEIPAIDASHREVELQFQTPLGAEVEVRSDDSDKQTVTVDRRNSVGSFKVTLAVTKNPVTVDGKQSFTTLIRPESPTGTSAGGPSTYTVEGEKSLDDILSVTAKSGPIAYDVPHTVGLLNGKPIILVVKPVGSLR
jgi:hypothetical protein